MAAKDTKIQASAKVKKEAKTGTTEEPKTAKKAATEAKADKTAPQAKKNSKAAATSTSSTSTKSKKMKMETTEEATPAVTESVPSKNKNKSKKAKEEATPEEPTGKSAKFGQGWSRREDKRLIAAVKEQGKGHKANWKLVAQSVRGRTAGACQARWNTELDPLVDRSPWTTELDAKLLELFNDPACDSWSKRGAAIVAGMVSATGEPMRRSGADCCTRYFKLTKSKKAKKAPVVAAAVAWDDETEAPEADLTAIAVPAAAKLTRNQANRARRVERRRKASAAAAEAKKAAAAEQEDAGEEVDDRAAPPTKRKFKDVAGTKPSKKGPSAKKTKHH
ncbi:hypothetical protein ACHHYP_12308 [Achlya hypogyna]|uniref:Myb-like domain-containing protein n=1 Tax=Achlya hypogyna TaxID=1202772 RepID=A0A1V9ZGZ1_ACHHY|nr:hypothetical protein ACHHYP_12308 [Achlya hypogyna]